jgi:hypothetical protein
MGNIEDATPLPFLEHTPIANNVGLVLSFISDKIDQ